MVYRLSPSRTFSPGSAEGWAVPTEDAELQVVVTTSSAIGTSRQRFPLGSAGTAVVPLASVLRSALRVSGTEGAPDHGAP